MCTATRDFDGDDEVNFVIGEIYWNRDFDPEMDGKFVGIRVEREDTFHGRVSLVYTF